MTFFHKTSSTRFWIRLQRHASGHFEALLSGLTCQDVYDCLKEEFDGKHLVLFSLPGKVSEDELFSKTLRTEHTVIGEAGQPPIYVIAPPFVGEVLRAEPMNENDQWWFFPYPKAPTPDDARALQLRPEMDYFWKRPGEALPFFVASVNDLTVLTKNREHVLKLIQKLFAKYVQGLELLSPEEAAQVDFAQQLEAGLDAPKWEADFTLVPDEVLRVFKDDARDWRRIVYEYVPTTMRFERREAKRLGLLRLIAENWGTIAVDLSSLILGVGTIIILLAIFGLLAAFIINLFS